MEYIVFNWAYSFGSDKNLTDHVSFAGTIVSIILAFVAIIYSFIQTESQNRSSNQIASQIISLRDVVKDMDLSKAQFSGELDRISGIATKLDLLDSHVDESHKVLSSVQNDVAALSKTLEQIKQEEVSPPPPQQAPLAQSDDEILFRKLLMSSMDTIYFSYCLKLSIGKNLSENDIALQRYAHPLAEIEQHENDGNIEKWKSQFVRKSSVAFQIIKIFKALGWLSVSKGEEIVTIEKTLQKLLNSIDFDKWFSEGLPKKIHDGIAATFAE